MKLTMVILAFLFGPQVPLSPPPPPPPPPLRIGAAIPETGDTTIEGVVRRLDSGAPLPDARVNLTGLPDRATGALSMRAASTDAAGRFVFRNLPASTYTVRATLENYFAPPIGGNSAAVASAFVNTNLQKDSSLILSLTSGGTISGSIRDGDGQPLSRISVSALRITYRDGRKTLEIAKTILSDDRGEFRLQSMPPGEYYIRANEIYFPGVPEAELATLVSVRGGDEVPASLRIVPLKTFRVTGRVVNEIPQLAGEPSLFFLMRQGAKTADLFAPSIFPNLARGKGQELFEIAGVRPGVYDLMPVAGPQGSTGQFVLGSIPAYTGRTIVEVRDRDVDGATAILQGGSDLIVKVNPAAAPSLRVATIRLGLRPTAILPMGLTNNLEARSVSADGTIRFAGVLEGTYTLVTPGMNPGVYVADIRQAARSIYDDGAITVGRSSAEPVEVLLATSGGRIEGAVEGAERIPGSVQVTLVPEGARRDNLFLYRRAALSEGRFVLTDIAPGNYKLYAWEDLAAGADANTEFMTPYENRGRAIVVKAGAVISDVALPIIRR